MATLIFDQVLAISLEDLKKLKFFKSKEGFKEAEILIKRRNAILDLTGIVRIAVSTMESNSYLEINFNANGNKICQRFDLIKSQTAPPKSYRWMLICPLTGAKCRKIYLDGDAFKSRKAIKGVYEINTFRFGHKRSFFKNLTGTQRLKKIAMKIDQPYSKPFYNGIATKRNRRSTEARWHLKRL